MSKEISSIPKNTPKSETGKPASKHETPVKETDDKDAEFRSMITSFCRQSVKDQEENRAAISELRLCPNKPHKKLPFHSTKWNLLRSIHTVGLNTKYKIEKHCNPPGHRLLWWRIRRSLKRQPTLNNLLRTILTHQREAISIPTTSYPSTPNRHRL